MEKVIVAAAELHFTLHGSQNSPPLMLLHGFIGASGDWRDVVQSLAGDFFCITPDLPWHGSSPPLQQGDAFEQTMQLLLGILAKLNIRRCALLGYSMGGRIAMYCGVHAAHFFSPLIIESAAPGIESENEQKARAAWQEDIAARLQQNEMKAFLRFWYDQLIFKSLKRRPNFKSLFAERLDNDPRALADCVRRLGTASQPALWAALQTLPTPLLFLSGEQDEKYSAIARALKRRRSNTTIEIIPGCGHNIHFENSAIFCKKVAAFLNKKSRPQDSKKIY